MPPSPPSCRAARYSAFAQIDVGHGRRAGAGKDDDKRRCRRHHAAESDEDGRWSHWRRMMALELAARCAPADGMLPCRASRRMRTMPRVSPMACWPRRRRRVFRSRCLPIYRYAYCSFSTPRDVLRWRKRATANASCAGRGEPSPIS